MIKMLRRNVLVDCGQKIGRYDTALEQHEDYKRVNSMGTILNVGPDCRLLNASAVGKKCILGIVKGEDNLIVPRHAPSYGLPPAYYFIAPENKIQIVMEDS